MGFFKAKVINYGLKEKVLLYGKSVAYGDSCKISTSKRQKYQDMSALKKQVSDKRRINYYNKKVAELKEIALMNTDLNMAVTLTFKDSITSYDCAVAKWQSFLKRLRHLYPDLKYICVWEYQKQRSKREGIEKGGILHFHCLMGGIGYLEHSTLEKIWSNGFVWIDYVGVGNENKRLKAVAYIIKYIMKEIKENVSERGKRYIFTSNNLLKPTIKLVSDNIQTKEDIIFEHMEDMIKDGEYDLHNSEGKVINHVDYLEYEIKSEKTE